jgi:hypothetical protein
MCRRDVLWAGGVRLLQIIGGRWETFGLVMGPSEMSTSHGGGGDLIGGGASA